MKTWGSGVIAPPFLTIALDGGELVMLTLQQHYPCGNLPHVPLPGSEYTVRIHGNQTIADSCNNRSNTIRF
jgi:hypothetical protein